MIKLNRYYVEDHFDEAIYTAGIVRKDNETILASCGFKALKFLHHKKGSAIVKLLRIKEAFSLAISCHPSSVVVIHFPLHAGIYKLLLQLLKWRGIQVIAIIIDIDGVRDNNKILLKGEIATLKKFNFLVVHNSNMEKFLQQYIPAVKMVPIEIFDYPFTGNSSTRALSKNICIAGNFSKAKFVYELGKLNTLQFLLYGTGYNEALQKFAANIFFKGIVAPHLLPAVVEGSFGLVWDGDSIEYCDEYLKINNPHKLSLYLAAGMPVIVWKDSAVAAFVTKHAIGITVSSLSEIDFKLNNISIDDYQHLQQNTRLIAEKLKHGYYLKTAIEKCTEIILQKATG